VIVSTKIQDTLGLYVRMAITHVLFCVKGVCGLVTASMMGSNRNPAIRNKAQKVAFRAGVQSVGC
jgi:hypothetical protein